MPGKIAGTIEFTINGVIITVAGDGIEYNVAPVRNEEILDANGKISGYKEIAQPVFMSGTLRNIGNVDQKLLVQTMGATITCKCANGIIVSIFNAAFAMESVMKTSDASMAFRFVGDYGTELLP